MRNIYTYEVYDIIHGDWKGNIPDGAFRTFGRPGWLVPVKINYEAAYPYINGILGILIRLQTMGQPSSYDAEQAETKVEYLMRQAIDAALGVGDNEPEGTE